MSRQEGDDSFQDLYENAPCGYLSTTPDGVIVRVNATLLAWTGHTSDELVGTPFADLLDVGGRLFYETRHLPVLRLEGEVREVALTMLRADGTTLPVLVNSVMVMDAEGRPLTLRTAVFDSTGRQDYEHQLLFARREAESSESRVRVLQHASSAFGASDSEAALADAFAESARGALSATAVSVSFVDHTGVLQAAGGTRPLDDLLQEDTPRPETKAYDSASTVTVASIEDAGSSFPEVATALQAARLEAIVAAPVFEEDIVVGVVTCYFGRQRQFDEPALDLLTALARQTGLVLTRIRLQRQLEQMALHDQLTGLANRTLLEERLEQALAGAERSGHPLAVIFLDLDGFKEVNDRLGHAAGDSVLRQVATRLRTGVRLGDIIGRFGGDEFAIVCDDADAAAATGIAERVGAAISLPFDDVPLRLTASIGVAVHTTEATTTIRDLFSVADDAMYRSKNSGKNRVTVLDV